MAMASCSSRATAKVLPKKYDVFISFRGDDTRAGFTSHLHASLCRSYFLTYIDYRIQKGNDVWEQLVKAIKQSTLFLVVFSPDYASSTWCLNELVEIMECCQNEPDNVLVIPVFYQIEPSQVRKQTGSYATAFAKHKKQHKHKIQKWKDVLSQAADLSGFHSTKFGTESDMIEEITRFLLGKLDHKYKNELASDFVLNENYGSIESLLQIDSPEVQVIGLWGMGGIGKTTLAEAIFHKFSFQYEGRFFFLNVTDELKMHGINYICNKLLSELLREDLHIGSPKVIPPAVLRRLKRRKAFVVLDDVRSLELLQNLIGVGYCWLGAGSRVIVTTRDKHVLISGGVNQIHQVKELNSQNSIQLFSMNAFDRVLPEEGYMDLSKRAIDYAKGNPLALKILGSVLRGTSKIEWNCALAKLKEIPNAEIDRILRQSYNDVDDKEKNIFLDFALFFIGHKRDGILNILDSCGFFADIGIRHLLDKALIRVDLHKCIQMHDLIREMGKQIVREESLNNPGQRSRLCDPKEIYDVLKNDRGTEKVEAIFLDATECTHISLSPKAFEKMPKLRLLAFLDHKEIKSISLPSGLDLLPENLRYFLWDGYPWKSLPRIFCPEMLVELSLRDSHVEKLWNGVLNLPNLEILDVSYSLKLIECPNVSGLPNLKEVVLSGCVSLPEVDSSIFLLQKLERLFMIECTSLKTLTSNTCSPALLDFAATYCINLQEFSVAFASVDCLLLGLPEWDANELPSSILHFKNLKIFTCPISDSLVDLPENFAICIWLVSDSMLKGERDTSITLRKVIPSPAFLSVKVLIIDHVSILSEIPNNIFLLSSLESLSLIGIAIRTLPETIKYLPRLKHLDVLNCNMLQSIPALSQFIPYFIVWNCESLEKVLSSTNESSDKPKLGFMLLNCIKLDQLSYQTVLTDAIAGIELGARQNAENEDPSLDHDDDIIEYFLPAMYGMKNWSHYPSSQAFFTFELPPSLFGFAYYLVLSQGNVGSCVNFGCECYWNNSSGERFHRTSFTRADFSSMFYTYNDPSIYMMSDHLVLWYDPASCKQIMEAVEEIKAISDVNNTSYNPKLTFRFFIDEALYSEVMIVECGFHWIYPFEGTAVPNRNDGFDSDNQEDTIPPTNKLEQCVVGSPSSLDVDESEEMRTESDLIEEISRIILGRFNNNYKNELTSNFILDENYWSIESSIKIDSEEVQVIGLWGMGGIGKTTLASAIFHEFSFQYEGSCFVVNVTEKSKRHGIIYVWKKLFSKLLGEDSLDIGTSKVIPSVVIRRLICMKVFIVLDDVDSLELLQNLVGVGYCWLGAGSRVIVTTRHKHVLISGGVNQIHQVKQMNSQNSLQLFSMNAFDRVLPEEGYMDLSKRAIDYAKGNPLALKILGSVLRGTSKIEWNCALAKLKEFPNKEIDLILRWSYDELDDTEKNIFLDIAFCFTGHKRDMITKILNKCGFYAEIGIRNLLGKALIRVDSNKCIQMHDLIQEMGKQVVREESPKNPGQHIKLCDPKEVCDVLKNDRGTKKVEAKIIDATECTHVNLSPNAFANMPKLRLLAMRYHKGIKYIRLPSGLDLLPENLRYFLWDGYPRNSLPPNFCPEMLVKFSLRHSNLETLWNGVLNLPNLEILDLSHSKKLIECPNVSGSPNLKEVMLQGCISLPEVGSSIFLLQKLESLLMYDCPKLKTLSSNTCSPDPLYFNAMYCNNLQEFSVPFASVDRMYLSLPKFGVNELPSSILHLKNLGRFSSTISDNLVNLRENFATSIWLVCENLPEGEPNTSITLSKVLPSPAFLSVQQLIIDRNSMLSEIPDNISLLSSLEYLSIIGIGIRSLPETIKYLPQLKYLEVIGCDMLQSIPALSQFIPYFFVWACGSLEKVLSSSNEPFDKPTRGFMFLNCTKLDSHSYQTVLNEAIAGIELGARLSSENEDPSLEYDIKYFLPAMSGMENWFYYHSTQASFTLELPPDLLGFAYYLILSRGNVGDGVDFGCECCLDNSSGERIYITSFKRANFSSMVFYNVDPSIYLMSDHLILWYDTAKCKQIMEAVEEIKAINVVNNTSYSPKLTFRFFIDESRYNEVKIVECGLHWIYPFEGSAVPNRNNDREDAVPPTNNLEQRIAGTLSSVVVDESEDLSYSLERLLHIGFDGDLLEWRDRN